MNRWLLATCWTIASTCLLSVHLVCATARAQEFTGDQLAFFEQKVRPLLINRCFECHSTSSEKSKGGLQLDSRDAILRGGDNGPAVVPGQPQQSLLVKAIHYEATDLEMPPDGKLSPREIATLEQWIRSGLAMPAQQPNSKTRKAIDIATGKQHWAFQPLQLATLPSIQSDESWITNRVDPFILAAQQQHAVSPSEPAEKVALLRRAKLDLLGLPPTIEEVTEFVADQAPDSFRRRLDRWLASPAYGERWARSWLELVRYCDTPESWSEVHHSYRYRDWVINAMNADISYDRFAQLQLAADQLPEAAPADLAALGFIGLSPTYWKELQLPVEIIKSIVSDEYEERIHTWSSTFLGLNLACARCHDHKFDPLTVQDYYALAGIFANSRLIDRSLEPGVDSLAVVEAHKQVKEFEQQVSKLEAEHKKGIAKLDKGPLPEADQQKLQDQQQQLADLRQRIAKTKQIQGFDGPMAPGVIDAKLEVMDAVGSHGSRIVYKNDLNDLALEVRGNPNRTGTTIPRRYVAVLSHDEARPFTQGSGRLELAEAMLRESAGLMARVMVNRIWRHHLGLGIVETPSDFGTQGTPPTHPELLDDLAYRFIHNDWSLKWLHREIMLSATYQQSSRPTTSSDKFPQLITHYPLRRLEVEAWRDAMLSVTGMLDHSHGGPPSELNSTQNARRTIYGTVKRRELTDLLRLHDFPDPITHSPNRVPTNTPLQQLFVLNSPFMQEQAVALVNRLAREAGADPAVRIQYAYQLLFSRNPSAAELALGLEYVQLATDSDWQQYAQTLLGCNEFLFLD